MKAERATGRSSDTVKKHRNEAIHTLKPVQPQMECPNPFRTTPTEKRGQHRVKPMEIWVYNLAYPVTALGPGERVLLWVSGCGIQCPGCITPHLWERNAGVRKSTTSVATRLLAIDRPLDGLTISGGEPFEQPAALAVLIDAVHAERPHWSVIIYSGHRLAALRRMSADALALLARTDILIDGAFRLDRPSQHPLTGSGNQCVHFLTERGDRMRAAVASLPRNQANLGLAENDDEDWLIGVIAPGPRASINQALGERAQSRRGAKPNRRERPPGATGCST